MKFKVQAMSFRSPVDLPGGGVMGSMKSGVQAGANFDLEADTEGRFVTITEVRTGAARDYPFEGVAWWARAKVEPVVEKPKADKTART